MVPLRASHMGVDQIKQLMCQEATLVRLARIRPYFSVDGRIGSYTSLEGGDWKSASILATGSMIRLI